MVDFITYPNRRIGLLCWREKVNIFRGQSTGKFQIICMEHRLRTHDGYFPKYFWLGLNSKIFCGKNNRIMEVMDKGMKVPKVVRPKIHQIPQNSFDRFFQLAQIFGISLIRLHWTSVVRDVEL